MLKRSRNYQQKKSSAGGLGKISLRVCVLHFFTSAIWISIKKLLWVQSLIPRQGCVLIYWAEILEETLTLFRKKTPCQEVEGREKKVTNWVWK